MIVPLVSRFTRQEEQTHLISLPLRVGVSKNDFTCDASVLSRMENKSFLTVPSYAQAGK
jgi:hypothetical protein